MKKLLVVCALLAGLGSCAFVNDLRTHCKAEVVQLPHSGNDTIAVLTKCYGLEDFTQKWVFKKAGK